MQCADPSSDVAVAGRATRYEEATVGNWKGVQHHIHDRQHSLHTWLELTVC